MENEPLSETESASGVRSIVMVQPLHARLIASLLCSGVMTAGWLSRLRLALLLVAGACLLTACSSGSYAPVSDRSLSERQARIIDTPNMGGNRSTLTKSTHYVVRKGDTLYSIAFRYGLDFKGLAHANGIESDYRIYPGQRLRLKEASYRQIQTRAASVTEKNVTKSPQTRPKTKKTESQRRASGSDPQQQAPVGPVRWEWPANGKVIKGYSASGSINKGINIAAATGDPVYAASQGRVVYAGSGLLGYGNLIIIKHDSQYLSAYAHNSKLLVKEGDSVEKREKIAEAGNSGTTRVMLHFEIRKNGNPLNPLNYLPKK